MKKLLSLFLALSMLAGASFAMAAPGDAAPIRRDEDGYDINSAAVVGDAVYIATWSGMLRYQIGDEAPVELEYQQPEMSNIRALAADGGRLYALLEEWGAEGEDMKGKLAELTLDGDSVAVGEPVTLDWSRMLTRDGEYSYSREYTSPIIAGGMMYLITIDDSWEKTSLMSFSLTDGSCQEIASDGKLVSVVPYKDGKLLALMGKGENRWSGPCAVAAFDPASGALTEAFEVDKGPDEVYGLAYDAADDTAYYVTGGQIHAVKALDPSTDQVVNDMPLQNNGMLSRFGYLIDGGFYMFYNYDTMLVRNVNPDQRPTRTLTIKGYLEPDAAYYAFTAAHPDVAVVMDSSYSYPWGDDVTKAMMNREDKVDIYVMSTNSSEYRALTGRGYVAELSDEYIREQVSRMYPAVGEALSLNGKLVAVPQSLYGSNVLSYNTRVTEKLKLAEDDLPKTWIQMIDFIERWGERYGDDFPEVTPLDPSSMTNIRRTLLSVIFNDYVVAMEASGEGRFDSPALRETLKRLDEADFSDIQTEESADGSYSWDGDSVLFNTWAQIGFSDWRSSDEVTWLLSFAEGEPPLVPLTLQVYVVNPFSKNQDIAQEYLKAGLERMKQPLRATLYPDENEPIRETYYKTQMRDMQKRIEELQKELEKAEPEEKQAYEGSIKEYQGYIDEYEKNSWAASAEDIARFREMAERLVVPSFSGFNDQNSEEMRTLVERYTDRQIPMEQFISGMDQKLRMMLMEGY